MFLLHTAMFTQIKKKVNRVLVGYSYHYNGIHFSQRCQSINTLNWLKITTNSQTTDYRTFEIYIDYQAGVSELSVKVCKVCSPCMYV
jgi:hypothetical protein